MFSAVIGGAFGPRDAKAFIVARALAWSSPSSSPTASTYCPNRADFNICTVTDPVLVAAALGLATGGVFGPGGDHPGGGPGGVLGPSASGGGGPGGVPGFEIGVAAIGDEASGIPKPGGVSGTNLLDLGGGVLATYPDSATRNGTGTVAFPLDDVAVVFSTLGGVLFNWVFVLRPGVFGVAGDFKGVEELRLLGSGDRSAPGPGSSRIGRDRSRIGSTVHTS